MNSTKVKFGWKAIRYLNGDQTHQGRLRIFMNDYSIQKFELYNYKWNIKFLNLNYNYL